MDNIDKMYLTFMQQGWSYDDVANADYYHLMRILSDKKEKQEVMDLADFIDRI